MTKGPQLIIALAMSALVIGLTNSSAWADGSYGHRGQGGERHGMHFGSGHSRLLHHLLKHQRDLGLTDEQVAKVKALALDQDRAKIRAHADVQVADRELRALVWDEQADLSVIQAKVKERADLTAVLQFMRIKGKRDLLAVLTPEQRDKLKALREQMRHVNRDRTMKSEHFDQPRHEGNAAAEQADPRQARASFPAY